MRAARSGLSLVPRGIRHPSFSGRRMAGRHPERDRYDWMFQNRVEPGHRLPRIVPCALAEEFRVPILEKIDNQLRLFTRAVEKQSRHARTCRDERGSCSRARNPLPGRARALRLLLLAVRPRTVCRMWAIELRGRGLISSVSSVDRVTPSVRATSRYRPTVFLSATPALQSVLHSAPPASGEALLEHRS